MEVQVSKRLPATRISIEKVDYGYFAGSEQKPEWDMWLYIDRFPPQLITTYKRKRDAVRGATRLRGKLGMFDNFTYEAIEIPIILEGRLFDDCLQ